MASEGKADLWLLKPEVGIGGKVCPGHGGFPRSLRIFEKSTMGSGEPSSDMQGPVLRSKNSPK